MAEAAGLLTRGAPPPPPSRPCGQWRRGGRASPLTAAGPSRTCTGFPHRAPFVAASLPFAGVQPGGDRRRSALGTWAPVVVWAAVIFAFSSMPSLGHRPRHVGHDPAQARAPRRVRDPRRAAPPRDATPRLAVALAGALRRLRRGAPDRSSRGGTARRSTSRSTRSGRSPACSSGRTRAPAERRRERSPQPRLRSWSGTTSPTGSSTRCSSASTGSPRSSSRSTRGSRRARGSLQVSRELRALERLAERGRVRRARPVAAGAAARRLRACSRAEFRRSGIPPLGSPPTAGQIPGGVGFAAATTWSGRGVTAPRCQRAVWAARRAYCAKR